MKTATTNKKNQEKELAITKEISPLISKVQTIKITSQATMNSAVEFLSQLNKFLDKLTEEKEKITKPMNEALKEVRSRYKPTEEILSQSISKIRSAMSSYQTAQLEIKRLEEEKIASKVAKGTLKTDTAIAKMEALKTPETKVETDSGIVKFRTDKILKITDQKLIPLEYYTLNERLCLAHLKAGQSVPGCTLQDIQIPVNSR